MIAVLRNGDWKKMLMENYLFWSLLFCHSKLLNKSLLFAIKFNCTVQLIFQKQKVLMCYLLILEHRASWWRWLSVCFSNANGFVSSRILLLWLIVPLGGMLGFFCSLFFVNCDNVTFIEQRKIKLLPEYNRCALSMIWFPIFVFS